MSSPALRPALQPDLIDALPHGVAVLDHHGRIVAVNRAWERARHDRDPIVGDVGTDVVDRLRRAPSPAAVAEHLADGLSRLRSGRGYSFQLQYRVDGVDAAEPRWFLVAAERLEDGTVVVTRTETTVHHGVDEVLAQLAFHDALTGLPNRELLLDRLRMALNRAHRLDLRPLVVFADLDGFKEVNDLHGHDAGDAVLVEAARRLSGAIRDGDTCGRWGGDEFVLVVELGAATAAATVVARLTAAMDAPFTLPSGATCRVGLSVGAVVGGSDERVEALLAGADHAMYEAKRTGRGPIIRGDADGDIAVRLDPGEISSGR